MARQCYSTPYYQVSEPQIPRSCKSTGQMLELPPQHASGQFGPGSIVRYSLSWLWQCVGCYVIVNQIDSLRRGDNYLNVRA